MKNIYLAAIIVISLGLCSCGITKRTLGLDHRGPDETVVRTNNPLILPPEYSVRPARGEKYEPKESENTEE